VPYCLASIGEEALGPVKAHFPTVGDARVLRWEWVGGRGSIFIEAGGGGMGRGNWKKKERKKKDTHFLQKCKYINCPIKKREKCLVHDLTSIEFLKLSLSLNLK